MTITISNLTISNNASAGTMIGLLTARDASGNIIPCDYTLTKGSAGYFITSDNQLLTAWSSPPTPGYYSVRVYAVGTSIDFRGSARFMANVVMAAPPPLPAPAAVVMAASPPPPPAPSIEVNGSANATVVAGSTMTISVTNGPGNATDWVGWYAAGAPIASGGQPGEPWVYANGTQVAPSAGSSSFSLEMAAPAAAGSYQMRFYANNSYALLASVPFTVTGPPPSIEVNGSANATVVAGAAMTISVTNGPGNAADWVGWYAAGAPIVSGGLPGEPWMYANGTQVTPSAGSSSFSLTMAAPATAGSYQMRFYANNSYTLLASVPFAVTVPPPPPPPAPSIEVNGSVNATVLAGSTMTISVTNGPGNPTDWVGWYAAAAPIASGGQPGEPWMYANGTQVAPSAGSSSFSLLMAAPATAGSYQMRFYANNSYTLLASVPFAVTAPPPPPPPPPPSSAPSIEVNGSANATVVAGSTMTISVTNGPGNPTDWVGWYAAGAPIVSGGQPSDPWVYANGTQVAPSAGSSSFSVMMAAPATAGSYQMRFYANNGYALLASVPFTVTPPPPPPPQPVITVTPAMPGLPDTTPLGAVVATFTVAMSDGSAFTGAVAFGPPFYNAGGIFALSGNSIIVNPAGPGLGPNMTSISDYITLEATA